MIRSRQTRSFLNLAAGETVARALSFLGMLVVARRLGPAMYGVVGVASGIMLYLNQVADAGVELAGVPAVARRPDRLDDLVSASVSRRLQIAAVLTVAVTLIGLTVFPQPDGAILAIYSLGLVFVAVGTRWVFLGLQRASWVATARIGGELVTLAIVVAALQGVGDVAIVPIATFIGGAVTAAVMLYGVRTLGVAVRLTSVTEPARAVLARGPHLVGFTLLGLILFNADLIYLRFIAGQSAAGYYAAAYTFIAFSANLSVAWAQSVMPTLARHDRADAGRNAAYESAMLVAFVASLPVAAGGMLTATPLIALVFGGDYLPAVQALVWLLPAIPIAAVREIAVVGLIGTDGGERHLIRVNATCAAFNIALLIPVVPVFGLVGAAAVTVLTECVRLILAFRAAAAVGYKAPRLSRFLKPALAVLIMTAALVVLPVRNFGLMVGLGCVAYAFGLVLTGVLSVGRPFQVRIVV